MKTIKELETREIPRREKLKSQTLANYSYGYKKALKDVKELIDEFKGQEYTDLEIWEEIKKELKKRING